MFDIKYGVIKAGAASPFGSGSTTMMWHLSAPAPATLNKSDKPVLCVA
jgi:hypothetical protein